MKNNPNFSEDSLVFTIQEAKKGRLSSATELLELIKESLVKKQVLEPLLADYLIQAIDEIIVPETLGMVVNDANKALFLKTTRKQQKFYANYPYPFCSERDINITKEVNEIRKEKNNYHKEEGGALSEVGKKYNLSASAIEAIYEKRKDIPWMLDSE